MAQRDADERPAAQADRTERVVVLDSFAAGATSTVHFGRARQADGTTKLVAVKRLHPHLADVPELRAVLLGEARLARRVAHPNVIQILDVIERGDDVLVVMEYLRGETLDRLVRDERPPAAIAVAVARDVLHGLHAAHHARGPDGEPLHIVHRDITPRNVIVTEEGSAKVLDFGIAKARGRASTTRDGHARGTLPYMAPEQLRGEEATPATDLRAVGVLLWEALTGKRLFAGDNEGAITRRILDEDAPAPSAVAAGVPAAIDAVVARAVARDPRARFATALEMALALEQAVAPAGRTEVRAWVLERAGNALAERDRRAEATTAGMDPWASESESDSESDSASESAGEARAEGRSEERRAVPWLLAAALGAAAIATASAGAVFSSRAVSAVAPGASAETVPPTAGSAVDGGTRGASSTVASGVGSRSDAPIDAEPAATISPVASQRRSSSPAATVTPPRSAPGASASAAPPREKPCVPYFVDDAGHRRFNRECLE